MSKMDKFDNVFVLRDTRPPVDPVTDIPLEIQEQLDEELLSIMDQIRELIELGEINSLCLVAFHDTKDMELTLQSARVWSRPTVALGLLSLCQSEVTHYIHSGHAAAEYEDEDDYD